MSYGAWLPNQAPPPGWGPPQPSMPPPMPQGPVAFPTHLSMAPPDRRVDETFGWFPAAFAFASLCGAVGTGITAILEGGFDDWNQIYMIAGGIVAFLLFAFWEFWRRTHVTSLVVLGPQIGVYRKGQLETVITGGQMTWFRLNFANSIREYFLFGMCGLCLPFGATEMFDKRYIGLAIWMVGLGVGGCLAFAGSVWSRGMCFHYYIPKGHGTETVVLPKSKLRRLGGWPFPL